MHYTTEELEKLSIDKLDVALKRFEENLQKKEVIEEINEEVANGYRKSLDLLATKANGQFIKIDKSEIEELGRLEQEFFRLALSFIHGGHLVVEYSNSIVYKVYIDAVEFFFHCDGKRGDGDLMVKDQIVNYRYGQCGKVKNFYWPFASLRTHKDGYHIEFDNEKSKYHASVLIDSFTVTDEYGNVKMREQIPKHLFNVLNPVLVFNPSLYWEDEIFKLRPNADLFVSFRHDIYESTNTEHYKIKEYSGGSIPSRKGHIYVKKPKSDLYYKKDLRLWQFRRH